MPRGAQREIETRDPAVEPVHPFERGVFNGFNGPPRSPPVDHLGLAMAVDRLSQGGVVAVASNATRWLDPGLGKALGILDREVLGAEVAVVDQAATLDRAPIIERLFESIQHEADNCRPADPPACDLASVDVDHEGCVYLTSSEQLAGVMADQRLCTEDKVTVKSRQSSIEIT